ncbi:hypothetical protein BJ322DRAFT_1021203 [Thelephora terrestris]|uniref:Uncharacterized protein n=1 Tax=Thelephora terrestris TaxID=56493 RepID=A0A9P6HCK5_9AGAM|nr:hypothetical protein BJ322DRAFT_1021198 [Thelephora terrestris]KAF9784451.1 hypothetical protein BJ322DRAFT_1021203 [Thelephora terrestris]
MMRCGWGASHRQLASRARCRVFTRSAGSPSWRNLHTSALRDPRASSPGGTVDKYEQERCGRGCQACLSNCGDCQGILAETRDQFPLLDSRLRKAGMLQAYTTTARGLLIEANPRVRIPRAFKRFNGSIGSSRNLTTAWSSPPISVPESGGTVYTQEATLSSHVLGGSEPTRGASHVILDTYISSVSTDLQPSAIILTIHPQWQCPTGFPCSPHRARFNAGSCTNRQRERSGGHKALSLASEGKRHEVDNNPDQTADLVGR